MSLRRKLQRTRVQHDAMLLVRRDGATIAVMAASRAAPRAAPRILLVDDDADIRAAFAEALGAEGYTTASAEHGRDALTQLASSPLPDLILLDLMMPVMNGKDFLAAIALQPVLAEIPLVVCTAFAGLGKELNRAVLRKPIDLDELLATVRAACGPASGNASEEWVDDEAPTDRMPSGPLLTELDRRERDPHEE